MFKGEDLSSILFRFNELDFAFSNFENLRMDGAELAEEEDDDDDKAGNFIGCSSTTGEERKKGGFFPRIVLSLSSRRKGAPQRSPLS